VQPSDAILVQQGGLGGPYAYASPQALVSPAIAQQITTATINLTGVGPIIWNQGQFLQATSSSFSFNWPGSPGLLFSIFPAGDATLTGMLSVGRDPLTPFEVATKNYTDNTVAAAKQLLTDNSVWTVNGKSGNVNLTWADLIAMGGAPITSPAFQGIPTVPSITDDDQHDWQIANTAFVQDVVNCKINALLHAHPFVWSFNGRIGNVWLTVDDVNAALAAPGAIAYATTPPLGDASTRIATTLFVDNSIEDLRSWVDNQDFALNQQLSLYAPLASPQFSGIPTAPTAPPSTSTGQLATTAYVMAAVQAATSGVVSFNGRTGIVDLTSNDITNAGGALLASPVFTGTPQAPTAVAGTDTAQLATCAFVLNELGGASIGVMTFNTRAGAVVLTGADITGAGGALLAGPAFSGVPTAPTASSGTATQQLATTAFVTSAIAALSIGVSSFNSRTGAVTLTANDISAAGGAVLASPIFSGQPTAPTASPGTSTTQLATTAYVMAAIAAATGVSSFNGRGGAVTLTAADVSGVGAAMLSGAPFTGNVAIGNASPSLNFNKTASGGNNIIYGNTAGSARWGLALGNGTAEATGNVGSDFSITRYDNSGATIDTPLSIARSSGNVTFADNVIISAAASNVARLYHQTAVREWSSGVLANGNYQIGDETAAVYRLSIDTSNVVINNNLVANFAASKPGGGAWSDSSDARIKTVSGNYGHGLDEIMQLQPVVYNYKGNDTRDPPGEKSSPYSDSPHYGVAKDGTRYIGLVAQHVEAVMPEMVNRAAGYIDGKAVADLLNLDTTPLIFALINATKQLAARVAALETVRRQA
jgi:hypothetical protein